MAATVSSVVTLMVAVAVFSVFSSRWKRSPLKVLIYLCLLFSVFFLGSLIRIKAVFLLGGQALILLEPLLCYFVGGGGLPSTGPNGAESSSTWEESEFELDVLGESFSASKTDPAGMEEGEPSVNQEPLASQPSEGEPSVSGPEGAGPALPAANQVPFGGDEAGPSNAAPFGGDEAGTSVPKIVGGDSVESIERRLLSTKYPYPSSFDIQLAHIDAEELFEVKVFIVTRMADLDPTGDWMERGARALDNPRTATGEPSLEQLYRVKDALNERGKEAPEFEELKTKVFLKKGGPGPGPGGGSLA